MKWRPSNWFFRSLDIIIVIIIRTIQTLETITFLDILSILEIHEIIRSFQLDHQAWFTLPGEHLLKVNLLEEWMLHDLPVAFIA